MAGDPEVAVGKEQVEVVLELDGVRRSGHIYLYPDAGDGVFLWRRVLEFLNESREVFPLGGDDGTLVLVGRGQLVRMVMLSPETNDEEPLDYFLDDDWARIQLADGSVTEGRIFIESDHPHTRLSDFLRQPSAFVHLSTPDHVFVAKERIRFVHPIERPAEPEPADA